MASLGRAVLAVWVFCAAFAVHGAGTVAFVSDIKGDVVLNGAGRPPFLAELLPGSRLVLAARATAAVMFVVSGEEFALKGPGEFVVAAEGVKAERGEAPSSRVPAFRVNSAVLVQTSKAATASLRMRGTPVAKAERPGPIYPVNASIASLQPTLRWKGEPGAEYLVVVTSGVGHEVYRGTTKGTSLRLPIQLVPGQKYLWSFAAGAVDRGDSRFEIVPADSLEAVEKARAAAKSFADRVVLALLLQELGAEQDAREVWGKLAIERPDIPELASLAR